MSNPLVIIETVRAAKAFLDGELAKYETWEDVCAGKSAITKLASNAKGFVKLRDQQAGRTTILKFLGKHWKDWMIKEALDTIRRETLPKLLADG